jgi:hypothetical protein
MHNVAGRQNWRPRRRGASREKCARGEHGCAEMPVAAIKEQRDRVRVSLMSIWSSLIVVLRFYEVPSRSRQDLNDPLTRPPELSLTRTTSGAQTHRSSFSIKLAVARSLCPSQSL